MGMLEIIILILVLMWLGGMLGGMAVSTGGLIHVLLIVAVIVLIYRLLQSRKTPL